MKRLNITNIRELTAILDEDLRYKIGYYLYFELRFELFSEKETYLNNELNLLSNELKIKMRNERNI
jgi:hypothetical protein